MLSKTLIVGVGNEYRRDDGVGPAVVRALEGKLPPSVEITVQSGEATALMDAWGDANCVILIDAVAERSTPGKVYRIDANATPLPADLFPRSTHDFGLAAAIELARTLGQLPSRVIVFGVEGQVFCDGVGLSPLVEQAVTEVANQVMAEFQETYRRRRCVLLPLSRIAREQPKEGVELW
jgi:hydrogenase maturation protease